MSFLQGRLELGTNNRILVFTSEYNAENGQAVVTRRVVKNVLPDTNQIAPFVYAAGLSFGGLASWVVASLGLFRALVFLPSDVVYVVCARSTLGFLRDLPGLIPAFLGKRVVVHCHGSDFRQLLSERRISRLVQFVYRRCEVIVPCRHLAEEIRGFAKQTHVCENFYADDAVADTEFNNDTLSLRVLWNSNIMASKGYFDVVAAVKTAAQSGCPISILCFGKILSDEEMSARAVERAMSKYADSDWYTHLGLVSHAVAVRSVQSCDVVALPSRYSSEMQPLAIIEAMCAGKNVIVSESASLRATVADYPAEFVPAHDRHSLTKCLEKLSHEKSRDPKRFATKNTAAAERAKARFSAARFEAEMKEILLAG